MARFHTVRFPLLVLAVNFEGRSRTEGFCHVNGWVYRNDNTYMSALDRREGGYLRGLKFRAQSDNDYLAGNRLNPMYGFQPLWDESSSAPNLQSLRRGVIALGEINRKLEKMEVDCGEAATFGGWVKRLATAAGIGKMSVKGDIVSIDEGIMIIDRQIADWQDAARREIAARADNPRALELSGQHALPR